VIAAAFTNWRAAYASIPLLVLRTYDRWVWKDKKKKNNEITYEVLHVRGLHVHDVEALARHLRVPQVDPHVVRGHQRLPVTVHERTDKHRRRLAFIGQEQRTSSGAQ
jgi:hypothetical protein